MKSDPSTGRPSPPESPRGSWLSVFFAIVLCVLGAVTLLVLPLGSLGAAVLIGGALFAGVIGFHYVVWGWWLGEILRDLHESKKDDEP